MMKHRERVLRALQFQEADRIPLDMGSTITSLHKTAHQRLKDHLGLTGGEQVIIDGLQQVVQPDERVLQRFDIDVRHVSLRPAVGWQEIGPATYRDEWGIVYREQSGYCEIIEHPLAQMNDSKELEAYPWPDPMDERRYVGLEDQVRELAEHSDYAIMFGGFSESFFGLPSWLSGHEKFYTDLLLNPAFVQTLLDCLERFVIPLAEESLRRIGKWIHVVKVADDLGTQSGTILSPDLYRQVIKPRQKKLYTCIKERTDAKLFMHSCGAIRPLIPDFIDIGVDILNPVQLSAENMEAAELKQEFGHQLVFWGGGCDTQRVLPFGTEQDVKREVEQRIDQLASHGGFVFSAIHNIQYDVPPENIVMLYDTAKTYGKYSS